MKVPHAQVVARALTNVRAATKKTLKGVNELAAQRMAKGDYSGAEALVAKGREVQEFQQRADDLLRAWRGLSGRGPKGDKPPRGETTPLWGYYQPILRAIVAAGGRCHRSDIEKAFEEASSRLLRPGDRRRMSGGRERWQVMIRRARKPLKAEGWIDDAAGTWWRITEAGNRAAERTTTASDA